MLPKHLLEKVRRGAQTAALIAALGAGAALAEEPAEKPSQTLSAEQLKDVEQQVERLGSESKKERGRAARTLYFRLGKPVIPELEKALAAQKNEKIKSALQDILKKFKDPTASVAIVDEDPCPGCGKG
ncbi:MAG TPA: hypothetical protein VEJ63_13245 [Planctomycetota bacterium]|nr:hypothetical protein [Planctomycetota bacterium]